MFQANYLPSDRSIVCSMAVVARIVHALALRHTLSLAYDAGLRVSELVGSRVADLKQMGDGSGRLVLAHSETDQLGEGALAWLSPDTMGRLSAWLLASGIADGAVFRRINVLTSPGGVGQSLVRNYIGDKPLTRQGVVAILRRRVLEAIDWGLIELEPGMERETVRSLSARSFRVGLTQDLFAAGEDGAGIALALRWSSPTTALRYARELAVGNNAAARVLGKLRPAG
jgi:integrase